VIVARMPISLRSAIKMISARGITVNVFEKQLALGTSQYLESSTFIPLLKVVPNVNQGSLISELLVHTLALRTARFLATKSTNVKSVTRDSS
jgi:hypothetical protein